MRKSEGSSHTILQGWTKGKAICLTTGLLGYAVAKQQELVVGALHGNLSWSVLPVEKIETRPQYKHLVAPSILTITGDSDSADSRTVSGTTSVALRLSQRQCSS